MNSEEVRARVEGDLAAWKAPVVEPRAALGVPWAVDRYVAELAALRAALVTPYVQRFWLDETYKQVASTQKPEADYWVVAATEDTLVWFDETTGEFGLGEPGAGHTLPRSVGVRGDLVGVYCAR